MKKTIKISLLSALLAASGVVYADGDLSAESVGAAIEAADAARAEAASLGNEWRWTGKYIEEAQAALAEGKLEEAMAKAERAKTEGELAVEQANKFAETAKLAQP